jgi:hypothetical protein
MESWPELGRYRKDALNLGRRLTQDCSDCHLMIHVWSWSTATMEGLVMDLSQRILSTVSVGGNQSIQRKPTIFVRTLTDCFRIVSQVCQGNQTYDLRDARRLIWRLRPPTETPICSVQYLSCWLVSHRIHRLNQEHKESHNSQKSYSSPPIEFEPNNYLGSVRHRGHKFGSYFFFHLCRAARVVEEPAEETTTSGK